MSLRQTLCPCQAGVTFPVRWCSGVWLASDAVASLQRHVQHVGEDRAPDAVTGLLEKGESLARAFDDGRNQPPLRRELLDQRRRDTGAGRRDADCVVWRVPRISQSPVAVDEEHVGVARTFQVLAREREGCGVDVDRYDQALGAYHFARKGGAVARADANLEEPVPLFEVERLVEQRIAVWAGDRGPLARDGERDLFVGVVSVARRDEVLATHGEHCPAESLGAKEPAPPELADLRFALTPQVLVALDRRARRRDEPSAHNRYPFWRTQPAAQDRRRVRTMIAAERVSRRRSDCCVRAQSLKRDHPGHAGRLPIAGALSALRGLGPRGGAVRLPHRRPASLARAGRERREVSDQAREPLRQDGRQLRRRVRPGRREARKS